MSAPTPWAGDTDEAESRSYSPRRRQLQSQPWPKPSAAAAAAAARNKRQGPVWLPTSPARPQPAWQGIPPRTRPHSPPPPPPVPPPALPWRMPSEGWVTSSATPSPEAKTGRRPHSPRSRRPSTPVERRAKLLAVQQQWQVASPLCYPRLVELGSSATWCNLDVRLAFGDLFRFVGY